MLQGISEPAALLSGTVALSLSAATVLGSPPENVVEQSRESAALAVTVVVDQVTDSPAAVIQHQAIGELLRRFRGTAAKTCSDGDIRFDDPLVKLAATAHFGSEGGDLCAAENDEINEGTVIPGIQRPGLRKLPVEGRHEDIFLGFKCSFTAFVLFFEVPSIQAIELRDNGRRTPGGDCGERGCNKEVQHCSQSPDLGLQSASDRVGCRAINELPKQGSQRERS